MEPRGRERHRRAARQSEIAGASESNALQLITFHRSLGIQGLGCGVGRTLGIGLPLGVGVGRGVEVAVAVGVGVGDAHGVSVYVRDWFSGGGSGQQMQKSSV